MIKKINIILALLLILISLGAVSAADDTNETVSSDEAVIEEVASDDVLTSADEDVVSEGSHTITNDNYGTYFNSNGDLISSDVHDGDTIQINDNFENKNFTFKKAVNIVGSDNIKLDNCIFTLSDNASGSTISNLKIFNTKTYAYGIFLNGVSKCSVRNCFVNNTGASSYAICIGNGATYNNITNNNFNAYGITYGHGTRSTSPVLISGSHYNQISNNQISCWDANGIYLSSYNGGPLSGGSSSFNLIYNNTVKYMVLPTSWSYAIQIMGGNNTIKANKIIGGYRGISTSGSGNIIIDNKLYNLTGADYNHPDNEIGGEVAIVGSYYSIIKNNTIVNAKVISTGCGISTLDYSTVENNNVEIVYRGSGINPQGSNIVIRNNKISTISGVGILSNSHAFNLTIDNNNVTSQYGVGILIQKVSSKRMPGNITITNNYVKAGNAKTYAIDAKDVDKSTYNVIEDNFVPKGYGGVITPDGVFDASKPIYKYNGTIIEVTPSNYGNYFKNNFLDSNVNDRDILMFKGEFHDETFFINKQVKIIGNDATFNNINFKVYSDGVWVENLTIKNQKSSKLNAWGILVYKVFGAKILNCNIEVYDPNAAYAIYVVESTDVDVINNTLFSSGDYLTYTLLVYNVDDSKFINNTIKTVGTNISYINTGMDACIDGSENCLDGNENCLDGDTFSGNHVVPAEVYRTYGILMLFSSGNTVSGNKINATSKLNDVLGTTNSTNSIVGIDLYYNSHNNIFSNNDIYIKAKDNYLYGMGVLGFKSSDDAPEGQGASNNQFINNSIVLDGTYFVEGFVVGKSSFDTQIISNNVNARSDCVNYGVNLEMSQNSILKNNNFTLNSDIVYGIQVFESSANKFSNNDLKINAKKAYGFTLSNSRNNEIIENNIFVNNTDEEITFTNFDKIAAGNAGICLIANSTGNSIKVNNVTSKKGYAILLDDLAISNIVQNNYLDSEEGIGDGAVSNVDNNNVKDNYKFFVTGELLSLEFNYHESPTITFKTTDENLEGANVEFGGVWGQYFGSSIISNGEATLNYDFSDFEPAFYDIYAIIHKKDYKITEIDGSVTINNGILILSVDNATGPIARNAQFTANVKNILNQGVNGITAKFYIVDDLGRQYIGKAVSDNNGLFNSLFTIPEIEGDTPIILVEIEDPYHYVPIEGTANLTAYWLTKTKIEINTNVYPNGVLAILKDQKGNVLSNKLVSVKIGSNNYNVVSNAKGEILMPIVAKGNYAVSIAFSGDEQYYDSKVDKKINVLPSITESHSSTVYYGNTIQYKVRVKGADGNYGAGNMVIIKVNGKTYQVLTDANGYATHSIKLKAGSYTVTAEYKGDFVSNKITFKPTLTAKNIVKKKAKKIKFKVKVVNKNGKAVKKKKVTFKIKGKKYTAKTNKKGVATLTLKKLKVGKYTITSSYGGCTIKNTIKIKK